MKPLRRVLQSAAAFHRGESTELLVIFSHTSLT
jgi:hypothetical protein